MTDIHDHPHVHDVPHVHGPAEAAPGPSSGAVVLDIGGDVGAAVVTTPAGMDALEIEIRRVGAEWDGTHVAVRERLRPGGSSVFAAVFPSLRYGSYELRVRFSAPGGIVHYIEVAGGQVAATDWPA